MKNDMSDKISCCASFSNDGSTESILELPAGDRFSNDGLYDLLSGLLKQHRNLNVRQSASVKIVLEKSNPVRQYVKVSISYGKSSKDMLYQYIELIKIASKDPLLFDNLTSSPYSYVNRRS